MRGKKDYEAMSFFEQLKKGLEESIAYSRGELALKTTTLPAPPPVFTPRRVRLLRRKLGLSQFCFALLVNVPLEVVKRWEQGAAKPERGVVRLLQIMESRPSVIEELFGTIEDRATRKRKIVA